MIAILPRTLPSLPGSTGQSSDASTAPAALDHPVEPGDDNAFATLMEERPHR